MPKVYEPISTERRRELIDLIYNQGMNISQAAKVCNIFYPTAKAINKVFRLTGRTDKKLHRNKKQNFKQKETKGSKPAKSRAKPKAPTSKQSGRHEEIEECKESTTRAKTKKNLHSSA